MRTFKFDVANAIIVNSPRLSDVDIRRDQVMLNISPSSAIDIIALLLIQIDGDVFDRVVSELHQLQRAHRDDTARTVVVGMTGELREEDGDA